MKKIFTTSEAKARASKLRDILDNHGHQLKHTESLEVISKLEGAADWNTYSAHLKMLERNPGGRNTSISSPANDQRKTPDEDRLLYCSFCDKSQHNVRALIAGPNIFICDNCTDKCIGILIETQTLLPGKIENMPKLESLIQESLDDENGK